MAEEGEPENVIEPEDDQYEPEEHVLFRRKQQVLSKNLEKLFSENVHTFSKIMNGTSYAFTGLKLRNLGLSQITDIPEKYPHLQEVDLSQNILKEIPTFLHLKYLTKLNLSRNLITNISFLSRESVFPYLKQINLLGNRIQSLPLITTKSLKKIVLNYNYIKNLQEFDGHEKIEILELRGNKIQSLKGLKKLKQLQELYIAENQIDSLKGLQNLPKLHKIHARKNKIASLTDYPDLPNVKYLNLRENTIAKVEELKGAHESIQVLNLLGTPLQGELADNVKKQVWMLYRNYIKINKSEVLAEERQQFDTEYKQILATRERERLEKEAQKEAAQKEQQQQPEN